MSLCASGRGFRGESHGDSPRRALRLAELMRCLGLSCFGEGGNDAFCAVCGCTFSTHLRMDAVFVRDGCGVRRMVF